MSIFSIHIENLATVQQKMEQRQQAVKNLSRPLARAAILTQQAAQVRIKQGGDPKWVPSQRALKTGGTTGIKTGAMIGGIIPGPVQVTGDFGTVSVGVSGPAAKYAIIFQLGSGSKAGHRNSKRGSARDTRLRSQAWMASGKLYVARNVTVQRKGQVPRPFLYFDDPLRQKILAVFRAQFNGGS
jgi:phage gpG-like protein